MPKATIKLINGPSRRRFLEIYFSDNNHPYLRSVCFQIVNTCFQLLIALSAEDRAISWETALMATEIPFKGSLFSSPWGNQYDNQPIEGVFYPNTKSAVINDPRKQLPSPA